jgi:hypothetical protein
MLIENGYMHSLNALLEKSRPRATTAHSHTEASTSLASPTWIRALINRFARLWRSRSKSEPATAPVGLRLVSTRRRA